MPVRQRVSTLSVNVKTLFIIQCHTPVTIIKTTYLLTYYHCNQYGFHSAPEYNLYEIMESFFPKLGSFYLLNFNLRTGAILPSFEMLK